ncbi:hypothetical protein [Nannocystis radixulma]|uniref:Uncharacterized protein n=1 Tax=Nannocystis radixulma TaxID=2995305 RepID=A0ABT5BPY1_9BACT|nr:hypothetical protein [Nannocystis radixulma]MDC0675052.1 hypothetical protein [Nannocystis radixulma]
MLRKIVILFPALAFTLPLVATSSAAASDPLPDTPTYPDRWEPGQFDQVDQIKPIVEDPCAPVWEETLCINPPCPDALVNPCTGEILAEEPFPLPDELDL